MSLQDRDKPRISSLTLRPVTRYMALLAVEIEAGRLTLPTAQEAMEGPKPAPDVSGEPGIPDPWDKSKPDGDPWTGEPSTVAKSKEDAQGIQIQEPQEDVLPTGEEGLPWAILDPDEQDVLWDEPEGERVDAIAPKAVPEDFARAMAYLSSSDDFLVTGVGRRSVQQEPQSAAPAPVQKDIPAPETPKEEPLPQAYRPLYTRPAVWVALVVLLLMTVGVALWYFYFRDDSGGLEAVEASAVYVGEQSIGCVLDGEDIVQSLETARAAVEAQSRLPAVLGQQVRIEPLWVDARFLASQEDMKQAVLGASDILVQAAGVYVDERLVAASYSRQMVDMVLEEGLEPFAALADSRTITDLRFAGEIDVRPILARPEEILDVEDLRALLVQGDAAPQSYRVVAGDSLTSIARQHDMTLGQLRYANPELIGEDLIFEGMEIALTPPQGLLTVQFTERVELTQAIPYQTVTRTSSAMFTTEKKVEVAGVKGEREVVAQRVYIAGVMVGEQILSEVVTKEPVDEVVVRGTKPAVSASAGTSLYIWPAQGTFTSPYGARWGKTHYGVDVANATGTPIYAARAGTVTFSGTNGGYGKMIEIDHGGGVTTRYAHCSSLKVSSGTYVKQGALIALMGSTGNSTGPHVHFEIRIGGVAKNPVNYLPKR